MTTFKGRLLLTVLVLATAGKCNELVDKEWWETALVYQIWPRGFQDSNGDGEGDLKGIIKRLDYLQDLGIDTIWLNPVYPSPLIDSGYDISNYTDINPVFGNLEHFDEFVGKAHERDLKVILDVVPNHSSNEHEWFLQSSKNVLPYKDYYIWADGTKDAEGKNIPPNNWVSTYSDKNGSAWTWHDVRQQWYYHKFHRSQPDLNLRNENVIQELLNVFNFWLKRGVDGFRINAVSYFFEDLELRDEPDLENRTFTTGLPENTALLYTFRSYINDWVEKNNASSKLLVAESYDSDEVLISLYGNDTHQGIPPYNFRFIKNIQNTSTAEHVKNVLQDWFEKLPNNASTNWVLSNHDNSRAASRIGLNRVDGLHMLNLLLPGQAFTYYGEEIAMLDRKMSWNETIDPMGRSRTNKTYENYSRDPARTPMQWNSDTSAGFSTNKTTYLPVHSEYPDRNVETQQNETQSNLNTYKALAALRKDKIFTHGQYEFQTLNNDHVFVLKRFLENSSVYIVVINLGLRQERVNLTSLYPDLEDSMEIAVASSNAINMPEVISASNFVLTANAALVLKGEENNSRIETSTTIPESNSTNTSSAATFESILQLTISTIIMTLLFRY
nr:PREDICTED: maltase A3-like isoform X2 [Megachile rotundata]XP_012150100.1 PREDICTED: maltase A3-like isoform X2 [Megachile rotundata]